jgi:HEAT repeat protein
MNTRSLIASALLASATFAPISLRAAVSPFDFAPASKGELFDADPKEAALYNDGTKAINESRWADAERIFSQVISIHGEYAEGATYWKAYAQNKEGAPERALETCASLHRSKGQSQWLDECRALEIEIRGKSGHPVQPQAEPDEELKLLALNSVMQQDPQRAIPIIQQILAGNGSDRLKERALFVLAQSKSKEAQDAIVQIARGQSNPALQRRAIQTYAAMEGKDAVNTLGDIYQHSTDALVKRTILQSYLITGSQDKVLEAARSEQNPQLLRTAVQTLGAMGDAPDLLALYKSTNNKDTKSDIIGALIATGHKKRSPSSPSGAEALSSIVASEPDPALRSKAIRNLGIAGGESVAPALVSLYQNSNDPQTKKAAIDALFVSGDAHDLVALARAEKDPQAKAGIFSKLSIMHNKEATDYMIEILNK